MIRISLLISWKTLLWLNLWTGENRSYYSWTWYVFPCMSSFMSSNKIFSTKITGHIQPLDFLMLWMGPPLPLVCSPYYVSVIFTELSENMNGHTKRIRVLGHSTSLSLYLSLCNGKYKYLSVFVSRIPIYTQFLSYCISMHHH